MKISKYAVKEHGKFLSQFWNADKHNVNLFANHMTKMLSATAGKFGTDPHTLSVVDFNTKARLLQVTKL